MFHYLFFRIFVFQKYQQGDGDEHEHLFELIQVILRNNRGEIFPSLRVGKSMTKGEKIQISYFLLLSVYLLTAAVTGWVGGGGGEDGLVGRCLVYSVYTKVLKWITIHQPCHKNGKINDDISYNISSILSGIEKH
jgi:hypothetical protein